MIRWLQWLWDNKRWMFSGIGVLVLILRRILRNGQGGTIHKQHAAAGRSVMQAGRDINVNVEPQHQPPALRVLVHRAYFLGNPAEHFFVKIVNVTHGADVEVTHVWYESASRIDILTRPLPARLRPSETWETYIPSGSIPPDPCVFNDFHVLISTGEIFDSEQNKGVPPAGYVAG